MRNYSSWSLHCVTLVREQWAGDLLDSSMYCVSKLERESHQLTQHYRRVERLTGEKSVHNYTYLHPVRGVINVKMSEP